ncbi:hypothetical protein DNI29_10295 [Hymenobacter sediminis]|uniref:hypothetical protein n=1 Tax=Hymenobacter sediminis TaxID=2218621 RepID=UPI000DA6BB51|nr:hypothetical protein [Hymenobacter sediminis]RPD47821.1 hypothetical protein DNI29_10295 [Hymenobacter sediminis]
MSKLRTFWLAAFLVTGSLTLGACNGDKGRDANTENSPEVSGDMDSNGSADINGYPDATSDSITAGMQGSENTAHSLPDETKGAGSPETTQPVGGTTSSGGNAGTSSGSGNSTGSTTGGQ